MVVLIHTANLHKSHITSMIELLGNPSSMDLFDDFYAVESPFKDRTIIFQFS